MTKDGEKTQSGCLSDLDFTGEDHQSWKLWRAPVAALAQMAKDAEVRLRVPASPRIGCPWRLDVLELAERKGQLHLHRLTAALVRETLLSNLAVATRKYFGARTESSFVFGPRGEFWCLFEFSRPGSREKMRGNGQTNAGALLPHGVAGFNVRLLADGAVCAAVVSNHFGFGYLPSNFASAPLRFLADALGLKGLSDILKGDLKAYSVHELRFPVLAPALACMALRRDKAADLAALTAALKRGRPPLTPNFSCAGADLKLTVDDEAELTPIEAPLRAPLEALESRERAARCRLIDDLLLAGKFGHAASEIQAQIAQDGMGLHLMRRSALLGLSGRREGELSFVDKALKQEPDNKLFLSYAVNLALESGDQPRVLALLSRLGELIMRDIPGAETNACFDVVLPELLGDAWCAEDRLKAEECYHRVIQRRGELPRVLRKLINLARVGGKPETEIPFLLRLAKVERRRIEQAKIYARLAELRRLVPTAREEAIQLALKALKLDRGHYGAAVLAAELLVEKGNPEDAIQLLDGLLHDPTLHLAAKAKARLETIIGRIWYRNVGRLDLAETRYEQATVLDPQGLDALRDLEEIYRGRANIHGLAYLLEGQFDAYERLGDSEAMRRVFDELVTLYRGVLGQPRRAFELYQRLLASTEIEPQEVDRVLSWRDVEIDWQDLYLRLSARASDIPVGAKRAGFLCRLAEICLSRLDDTESAMRHYAEALDEGGVDEGGFRFLVEALAAAGDHVALARCYERRLGQVAAAERRGLLLELLALPKALTDQRRDELALEAYELDQTDPRPLEARFREYQALDDVTGLARLIGILVNGTRLAAGEQAKWARFATQVLEGCVDEQRYALMDDLYGRLLVRAEDKVQLLQEAIGSLRDSPDPKRLARYVAELLEAGVVPALGEKAVERLLAGLDHELALYHQLMSYREPRSEAAAGHARIAAVLYGKRPGELAHTEKMLARLCSLVPCAEEDLAQLTELVGHSGNWSALAKALQKQVDFEDERQRKYELLERLGNVYWKKLKDLARARLAFVLAQKYADRPERVKLALAEVAFEAGDLAAERKALIDYLQDPESERDPAAMGRAVLRLVKLGEEPQTVRRLIMARIDAAQQADDLGRASLLANILIDNEVPAAALHQIAFRAAVRARQAEQAVEHWWKGLACVSNRSRAKAYMAETALILEREDRRDLLVACFKAALDNQVGDRAGPKIRQEILLQYGALLFDSDTRRQRALAIYRDAYAADPEDSRSWMPLYFLLLEFATPEQRRLHLRDILPRLEADPRPLKSFPITIESMTYELRELEAQHGAGESKHAQTGAAKSMPAEASTDILAYVTAEDEVPAAADAVAAAAESDLLLVPSVPLNQVAGEASGYGIPLPKDAGGGDYVPPSLTVAPFVPPVPAAPATRAPMDFDSRLPVAGDGEEDAPPELELGLMGAGGGVDVPQISALNDISLDTAAASYRPSYVPSPASDPVEENLPEGAWSRADGNVPTGVDMPAYPEPPMAAATGSALHLVESPSTTLAPEEDMPLAGSFSLDLASEVLEPGPEVQGAGDEGRLVILAPTPPEEPESVPSDDHLAISPAEPPVDAPTDRDPGSSVALDLGMLVDAQQDEDGPLETSSVELAAAIDFIPADAAQTSQGGEVGATGLPLPAAGERSEVRIDAESARPLGEDLSIPEPPQSATFLPAAAPPMDAPLRQGTASGMGTAELSSVELAATGGSFGLAAEGAEDGGDWRAAVIKGDFNADLTGRLVKQAFASELEKHIAIQCVALVAGNCDRLANWHWRVWRNPGEYGYPLAGQERYPTGVTPPALHTTLHRFVIAAAPVLVRRFKSRFTPAYMAKRLDMSVDSVAKLRRPLPWDEGLLHDAGFYLYASLIAQKRFQAFSLPGLGSEIFYDGRTRSLYLDEVYFRKAPPSHLFHKLLGILWSVRIHYFVPLALHPQKQFMPFLGELHHYFGAHGFSRIKTALSSRGGLGKLLADMDTRQLRSLHEKIGQPSEEQVGQLWEAMRGHIIRLLVAETLDVIGVFESMLDKDFLRKGALKHSEIYHLSPYAKSLIEFVTKLNI